MSMDAFDAAVIWLRRPMPAPVVDQLIRLMRRSPAEMFFLKDRSMAEGSDSRALQSLLAGERGALLVVEAVGPGATEAIQVIRGFLEDFESSGRVASQPEMREEEV